MTRIRGLAVTILLLLGGLGVFAGLAPAQTGPAAPAPGAAATQAAAKEAARARRATIMWNEAKRYIGLTKSVRGPVKGTMYASSSTGKPTFLNVGKNYPSAKRFTVVIWGKYRAAFPSNPQAYYRGKTVIATGKLRMYQGCVQMTVRSSSKLKVVK